MLLILYFQGIIGSSLSGKSFLLHRYLTGSYAKVESYTGRHKKEVIADGQSHLLLIRNETGPPDLQVSGKHKLKSSCEHNVTPSTLITIHVINWSLCI